MVKTDHFTVDYAAGNNGLPFGRPSNKTGAIEHKVSGGGAVSFPIGITVGGKSNF
jgi:hypothetical protein